MTSSEGVHQPLLQTPFAHEQAQGTGRHAGQPSPCALDVKGQGGDHRERTVRNKLVAALVLSFVFMIVEVSGGFIANSLAIMTDAAHLLSDVSGFAVAIFAAWYAAQRSKTTHTFGYHRIEVLGALASVLSTWLVTGVLVYEAIDRIRHPVQVNGKLMTFLALVGVVVNAFNFFILGHHGHSHSHDHDHGHDHGHGHGHEHEHATPPSRKSCCVPAANQVAKQPHGHNHGHEHRHGEGQDHGHGHDHDHGHVDEAGHDHEHAHGDVEQGLLGNKHDDDHAHDKDEESINLRGAVLHVIGDLVQSIGVAMAGALIWWKQDVPRWYIADPICTFIFAALVLLTTTQILRDISDILMERVPRGHDFDTIYNALHQVNGVSGVHDLHVWALKPGFPLLAAHLALHPSANPQKVLEDATAVCQALGIDHTTLQLVGHDCPPVSSSPSQHRRSLPSSHGSAS